MTKSTRPRDRNPVHDDAGAVIGWWSIDGDMIRVESLNGQTNHARPSPGANEALARIMLREPWAQ